MRIAPAADVAVSKQVMLANPRTLCLGPFYDKVLFQAPNDMLGLERYARS